MDSILTALKDTPIPTILVVAGIVFLLLSIAGQLAGRIAVAPERQRWAALVGGGLLTIGVALHVVPQLTSPSEKGQRPSPPAVVPSPQPTPSPPERQVQPSPGDQEPNDDIATATVITEGTTIRGLITTDQDRDFFKFNPSGSKTRVILRTHSSHSFIPVIILYDHVEKQLAMNPATVIQPASFSFASIPGSVYYLVVKSVVPGARGDYELVVRKE
jgi:hypothetical protein